MTPSAGTFSANQAFFANGSDAEAHASAPDITGGGEVSDENAICPIGRFGAVRDVVRRARRRGAGGHRGGDRTDPEWTAGGDATCASAIRGSRGSRRRCSCGSYFYPGAA